MSRRSGVGSCATAVVGIPHKTNARQHAVRTVDRRGSMGSSIPDMRCLHIRYPGGASYSAETTANTFATGMSRPTVDSSGNLIDGILMLSTARVTRVDGAPMGVELGQNTGRHRHIGG